MYFERYSKDKSKVLHFVVRLGKWRASDVVAEIRDKIYILPCLCFFFNSSEFYFGFAWLNFKCDFWTVNFNKKRHY